MKNIKYLKSRKEYKCIFCGGIIEKGTEYALFDITPWNGGDGQFSKWKGHVECEKEAWNFFCTDGNHYLDEIEVEDSQKEFSEHMKNKRETKKMIDMINDY